MSIFGLLWRNVSSRLLKHLLHHLVIPLTLGLLMEAAVHKWLPEDNAIARALGPINFRYLILILGVLVSWLLVMVLLIAHETKKRLDLRNLISLEEGLNKATSYYGISTIPLRDWFNPGSQVYLAKLMKRKLEVDYFEHHRTLLFFSNRELKDTEVDLMDESHHGKCLAFLHRDFGIPLSFLERKEIFEILKKEFDERELSLLGCYPRWTRWPPFAGLKRVVPLNLLRRRIPQLDFGLVTHSNGEQSVLRVRRSEEQLRIQKQLSGKEAEPYIKFAEKIEEHIYAKDSRTLIPHYDFLDRFGSKSPSGGPTERDVHQLKIEKLAQQHDAKFKIKRYTRFVDIAEKSGDVSVREEFDGVTSFPSIARREKLERHFISQAGHFHDPEITEVVGTQIGWEWGGEITEPGERRKGFITFDPPVESDPVKFVVHRETLNAIHFNQRDRQDQSEEVFGLIENLYGLYVLKARFPENSFPPQFRIQVEAPQHKRDMEEEKRAHSCLERLADKSTVVLALDGPLPGYTYRIRWDLPKEDIEEQNLTRRQTQVLRDANKLLLSLGLNDERLKNVQRHLKELQAQIAHASIGYPINDPGIEVSIHAYDDVRQALVMVASTGCYSKNVVASGRSTVGRAYKSRGLVSWIFASDSLSDQTFWDYGSGHLGIISIPLCFPLQTTVGGRVGVLSIATNSPGSGLLNVVDIMDVGEQLGEPSDPTRPTPIERRAAIKQAFTNFVNAWYATTLANAIGLPDLSDKTLNQPQAS